MTFKPPKSKYGRREVPLDAALTRELRARRKSARFAAGDDLVFPARNGAPLRQENVRRRVLKPAVEEAVGDALDLGVELAQGGNRVATRATGMDRITPERELAKTAR